MLPILRFKRKPKKMSKLYNTEDKKVNIQSFLNFMQKFTYFMPVWHHNPDGNYTLKSVFKETSKTEKLIASKLYYNQTCIKKERNSRKTYDRLQFVRNILETRNLNESELKKALEICASSLLMLQTKGSNGKLSWFESNSKGTKRYNKVQQGKILDFVEEKKNEGKDCFFLTLTCDVKKYPSRAYAWENYLQEEVYRVTENLRKHYEAEYVATLESTANGYPHIHMMLFFPHNTFAELKHYHNQQKIKKGRLFDMVKSSVNSEVFDLQAAKGKNLKWYLVKYIGKGIEEDVFSILNKKDEWKKSDLKQVQEFIYLKAFSRRKLLMTRKNCKKSEIIQKREDCFKGKDFESLVSFVAPKASTSVAEKCTKNDTKDQVCVLLDSIDRMSADHATKLRGYLTSLCTNSPSWEDISIESMSFHDFISHFGRVPGRNDDVSEEDMKTFHFHSQLMVNTRNFIEDFMKFVVNPENSDINRKEYVSFYWDIYNRMLDKYDFSDDRQFLKAVFEAFCFYVDWILVKNKDYKIVLQQRENKSYVPRIAYTTDFEPYNHICASAVDSWYSYEEVEARMQIEKDAGHCFDSPFYEKNGLEWTENIDRFRRTEYTLRIKKDK